MYKMLVSMCECSRMIYSAFKIKKIKEGKSMRILEHTSRLASLGCCIFFLIVSIMPLHAGLSTVAEEQFTTDALLTKMINAYQDAESFYAEGTATFIMRARGKGEPIKIPLKIALERPNKIMTTVENPIMGYQLYSDGHDLYSYIPGLNQYRKKNAPDTIQEISLDDIIAPSMKSSGLLMIILSQDPREAIHGNARAITVEPQEKIEGRPYNVLLINQKDKAVVEFFIDPESFLIKKLDIDLTEAMKEQMPEDMKDFEVRYIEQYEVIKVNEDIPASTFTFDIPEESKKVSEYKRPGQSSGRESSPLKDTVAPAFTLEDLEGARHSLSDYAGKVVLLDFWSTRCPPCIKSMPFFQELHEKYKDKGLAVLGITTDRRVKDIEKMLKKHNVTYTILLDTTASVSRRYRVESIPRMVVVGRKGKVLADFIGFSPAQEKSIGDTIEGLMNN